MKKNFFGISFLAASALAIAMTSCQNDEMLSEVNAEGGRTISVVATATVGGDATRTDRPVADNGDLPFHWSEGDQVVLISEDGRRNLGVLTLVNGVGNSIGELEGQIDIFSTDKKANVYYFGKNADNLTQKRNNYTVDLSTQLGANEEVSSYDIMHAVADIDVNEQGVTSIKFNLNSILGFSHFYLNLPEGVNGNGDVTINGANIMNKVTINLANGELTDKEEGPITVSPNWNIGASNEGEIYMVVVPNTNVTTSFTVTCDEKTYRSDLRERTYSPNKVFNGGTAHGKDVYFSENDEWTVTYMNGEEVFETVTENSFAPSMAFTAIAGPEKEAFKFLGWAEKENGNVVYTAGQEFTLNRPETEKTLYAVFEDAKADVVTVYAWNNDGSDNKDPQQHKFYNVKWPYIFHTENLDKPVREGYVFMGWATSADSKKAISTVTFEYPETEKNVYAIWEEEWKSKTYTLYYWHGNESNESHITHNYNSVHKTPWDFICDPNDYYDYTAPEGYELIGWADKPNATVAQYTEGDKITTGGPEYLTKTVFPVLKKKASEGTITAPGSTGTVY